MQGKTIVILTGAGISAESGLATFRDNNGLWCNHRIEDVATPEAFARNPALVHEFYNLRRAQLKEAKPNAAHIALAELSATWEGKMFLVTQNVDDLHERAGLAQGLFHMHGELKKARCTASEEVVEWHDDMTTQTICACCNKPGRMRPHIVWFGEMPLHMDLIYKLLADCDLFISIGTSGNVYPAAGFVQQVRMHGRGHTVELNMEPSRGHSLFHEKIYGPATKIVPEYVKRLLNPTS
jgi:NAD-dependent deacetylase